jgi:hypothetical protein
MIGMAVDKKKMHNRFPIMQTLKICRNSCSKKVAMQN